MTSKSLKKTRIVTDDEPEQIVRRSGRKGAPGTVRTEQITIPKEVAILPVRNMVLFPGTVVPLAIGREKSRQLIKSILPEEKVIATFCQKDPKTDDPESQKQLLVQSWQVLQDILAKYPDVDIADRVRSNILTVEKKINEMDPLLLIDLQERQRQKQRSAGESEEEIDGFDIETSGQAAPPAPEGPSPLPVYTPQSLQLQ